MKYGNEHHKEFGGYGTNLTPMPEITHVHQVAQIYLERRPLRPSSVTNIEALIRALHPDLTGADVTMITPQALLAERGRQLRRGCSESTSNSRIRKVITLLRFAATELGLEIDGATLALRLPRVRDRITKEAPDSNVIGLVWKRWAETKDPHLQTFLLCYYAGGARISDVITWNHTDNIINGQLTWRSSKTAVECSVPLCERLALLIHAHRKDNEDGRLSGVSLTPCDDPMEMRSRITSANGRINYALKKHNFNLSCHSARKIMAHTLISQGVDLDTVRRVGGWSSSQMVLQYAARVDGRNKKNSAFGLL